jgi:hypothetical protein
MNAWVDTLISAIARREGEFSSNPEAIPRARNNPLDLRFAGQVGATRPGNSPKRGEPEPIARFDTLEHGIAAGYRQVWLDIARGMSLRELITAWAPPNENDTAAYLAQVQQWTGIEDADRPLLDRLVIAPPSARE